MKLYAFKHPNGGYLNKEGGEPCGLCSETLVSYSRDDAESPCQLSEQEITLLDNAPCVGVGKC